MSLLAGSAGPAASSGWGHDHARKGFFTDTSICIGCKACEVACNCLLYTSPSPRD